MIVSDQITRDQALEELKKPLYDEKEMQADIKMILSRLNISEEEFNLILSEPSKQHTDYPIDWITTIVNKIRLN